MAHTGSHAEGFTAMYATFPKQPSFMDTPTHGAMRWFEKAFVRKPFRNSLPVTWFPPLVKPVAAQAHATPGENGPSSLDTPAAENHENRENWV